MTLYGYPPSEGIISEKKKAKEIAKAMEEQRDANFKDYVPPVHPIYPSNGPRVNEKPVKLDTSK